MQAKDKFLEKINLSIFLICLCFSQNIFAKDVFEIMFATSKSPKVIVKEKGLEQVTDDSAIEVFVDQVINENNDKVKEYLSGKDKLFGFFVGQVMKVSQGKANPGLVNEILKSKLK